MSSNISYLEEIESIKPVIIDASDRFILPRYRKLGTDEIVKEGRNADIVTLADTETSDCVLPILRKRFLGSFTEEEISDDRFDYDVLWVLDPLDGTDEFRYGKPWFAVQGALLERNKDVYVSSAGFIYDPLTKKFVYGSVDRGPFMEVDGVTQKIDVPEVPGIVAHQRESDVSRGLEKFLDFLRERGLDTISVKLGGAGNTVIKMIEGELNLYLIPQTYTKEWDAAPFESIVSRLGGWVSDLYGRPFTYNRKNVRNEDGVIVGLGVDKEQIIKSLQEFGVRRVLGH